MSSANDPQLSAPLPVANPEESKRLPVTREELVVVTQPSSQQAEQFRTLRNSIVALNPDGAPRTVVMTSALRNEGKSIATLNLGFALAEMPSVKVLLIDANLHAPSLENYLGLPRARDCASYSPDGCRSTKRCARRLCRECRCSDLAPSRAIPPSCSPPIACAPCCAR
jgi:Mrp family chromosome partitioning ATPase